MIGNATYRVADPEQLETPAMVLFADKLEHNIQSLCELVGGGENVMAHVKTHKCADVVRRQLEHGVDGFKCVTLRELQMVLEAGAKKAILAYPQIQTKKLGRLCDIVARHPDAWIASLVSKPLHLDVLAAAADASGQELNVMLDLDAGMHRTGRAFDEVAIEMYRQIAAHPLLIPGGIHWYDGHDNLTDPDKRRQRAHEHIKSLNRIRQQLESDGMSVPHIVAGGSWSFQYYARAEGMQGSPGTFSYWDVGFATAMPDLPFEWAAMVLTQVVDQYPDEGLFTTDLGCKAISSDLPEDERALLLGYESAELVLHSEEHGVFRVEGDLPAVGDYLLAVPGHICPTAMQYPGIHVVDNNGEVVDWYRHTARDRQ